MKVERELKLTHTTHEFVRYLNSQFPDGKKWKKGQGSAFTYMDVLNYAKKGKLPDEYGNILVTKVGRGRESVIISHWKVDLTPEEAHELTKGLMEDEAEEVAQEELKPSPVSPGKFLSGFSGLKKK